MARRSSTGLKPGGDAPRMIINIFCIWPTFMPSCCSTYHFYIMSLGPIKADPRSTNRPFACAFACINVSRNLIHITAEMKRRGLLIGAYCFSMYMTFFAIISILYFVLENPNGPTSQELLQDAAKGKDLMSYFAQSSPTAVKCTETIETILEKLPEDVKREREHFDNNKFRRETTQSEHAEMRPPLHRQGPMPASIFPESIQAASKRAPVSLPQRAHMANLQIDPTSHPTSQPGSNSFEDLVSGLTPPPSSIATSFNYHALGTGADPTYFDPKVFPPTPVSALPDLSSGPLHAPALSDLSSMMMFPSIDLMAYPNPNRNMTTAFESNQGQAQALNSQTFFGGPNALGLSAQFSMSFQNGGPGSYTSQRPSNFSNGNVDFCAQGLVGLDSRSDGDVQLLGRLAPYGSTPSTLPRKRSINQRDACSNGAAFDGDQAANKRPEGPTRGNPAMNMNDDAFGGVELAWGFTDPRIWLGGRAGDGAGGSGFTANRRLDGVGQGWGV